MNKGVAEKPERMSHPDHKILPEGKFVNSSSYTGDYINNPVQHTEKFKLEGEIKLSNQPFQG